MHHHYDTASGPDRNHPLFFFFLFEAVALESLPCTKHPPKSLFFENKKECVFADLFGINLKILCTRLGMAFS